MGSTTKVGEGVRREDEAVGEDSSPRKLDGVRSSNIGEIRMDGTSRSDRWL
jgi:hypothetical protein